MIRQCDDAHFEAIWATINDGAEAYQGIIPQECWEDPYMPRQKLRHEIADGVVFWGYEKESEIKGVMGIQAVQDVVLIRHAYVRTNYQKLGIGGHLMLHLKSLSNRPILIGTWASAIWAIRFYEKHGFNTVGPLEKDRLLRKYWTVPERQIKTSVVLADPRWRESNCESK